MLTIIRNLKEEPQQKAFLWQIMSAMDMSEECYVHGDLNIYVDDTGKKDDRWRSAKEKSEFRKDNCSPQVDSSKWYCRLKKGDKVPETIEELEKLMIAQKEKDRQTNIIQESGERPSIKMPEEFTQKPKPKKEKENGTKNS